MQQLGYRHTTDIYIHMYVYTCVHFAHEDSLGIQAWNTERVDLAAIPDFCAHKTDKFRFMRSAKCAAVAVALTMRAFL